MLKMSRKTDKLSNKLNFSIDFKLTQVRRLKGNLGELQIYFRKIPLHQ